MQVTAKERFNKRFGAALRNARKDAGVSQYDVAAESGVSRSTVNRIERGEGCSLFVAYRLFEVLGLDLREFF